ncbi:hypothetical protein R1sor_020018 [Riccia sorocarpa]|uniref:Uncharacterized protein n=1 Tax=Riccia sorocarpa TaxID=122646 RepID=A0ABD3IID5_9MARC
MEGASSSSTSWAEMVARQDDFQRGSDLSAENPLQALERIMQRHPSLWDRSSIEGLFLELEEMELGEGVPDHIRDTAQHVRKNLLEPLVRLCQAQDKLLQQEQQMSNEKKQQASLAMVVLLEERNLAIQQFQEESQRRIKQNQFSETLLRDLDEMAKTLEQSRLAQKNAKRLLVVKEAEIQRLNAEKRMLVKLIIEGGPWELWEWVKKEIVQQGLEPGPDFSKNWLGWLAANEKFISTDPSHIDDLMASISRKKAAAGTDSGKDWIKCMDESHRTGLLRVIFSIIMQEGTNNLRYVLEKGLFFLPMAWFYFWLGLSSRITRCITGDIVSRVKRSPLGFVMHLI